MATSSNQAPTPPERPVGLLRASGTVGGMTLLSRISGFARDVIVARLFGADAATDAFFVAFKIPNFFRRLFAEGAFSQAFVPVFAEYRQHRSAAALRDLVGHVFGCLGGFLLLLVTLGVACAPLVMLVFAPGFIGEDRFDLAAHMLRFTFPYLFFISLVAVAGGILNSYQRFAVPAFTPVFLNLCLIGAALWLRPLAEPPVVALAWGAFLAGVVQLLFQIPFLMKLNMLPRPRWRWRHEGVRRIVRLMLPAILGSAVVQINLLLDTVIASMLIAGSVSWLYFADRLVEFPLGVFGIAIATVILPSLSRRHAASDPGAFSHNLDWALRLSFLLGVPACLGLVLLAGPILATLFQYGEFGPADTRMAGYSLMAYAAGLPAFILIKVLAPGFFARQDTRTPVRIGIIAMLANMAMNLAFVGVFWWLAIPAAHAALALATALSAWLHAGLLFSRLRREGVYRPESGWLRLALQILGAAVLMAGLLWLTTPPMADWQGAYWQRGWMLAALIAAGAGGYALTLWLAGIRPAHFRGRH